MEAPVPQPTINQINLISDDFDSTIDFYRMLGMQVRDPHHTPSGEPFHAEHQPQEGTMLEIDSATFARVWNRGWAGEDALNGRIVVGLSVSSRDEVDNLYREATARGHRALQEPYDAFWGARYAVLEDPNGLAVGLMSPIDEAYRSAPPSF